MEEARATSLLARRQPWHKQALLAPATHGPSTSSRWMGAAATIPTDALRKRKWYWTSGRPKRVLTSLNVLSRSLVSLTPTMFAAKLLTTWTRAKSLQVSYLTVLLRRICATRKLSERLSTVATEARMSHRLHSKSQSCRRTHFYLSLRARPVARIKMARVLKRLHRKLLIEQLQMTSSSPKKRIKRKCRFSKKSFKLKVRMIPAVI